MKKFLYWFFLFNKRLYKKPIFLIILLLIPALIFSFSIASRGDSGFLHIVLAGPDENNAISNDVINSLLDKNGLILFSEAQSTSDAIDMVKNGKADAAWIFPEDIDSKLESFSADPSEENYVIDVFQREQTIPLRLSGEVLCSEFFRHCSRTMYMNYVRDNVDAFDKFSDDRIYSYYDEFEKDTELFRVSDSENTSTANNKNYLLAPLRGLLSIIVLLCGLAATLFFIQDKKSGTFSLLPENRLPLVGFMCQFIAVLNVGVVVLISLFLSGLAGSVFREIPLLVLYCFACSVFCSLVHLFIKNIKILGALIPLLIIFSIVACPIFFNLESMYYIRQFFPPTHYINATYDNFALLCMAIYCGVGFSLFLLIPKIKTAILRGVK